MPVQMFGTAIAVFADPMEINRIRHSLSALLLSFLMYSLIAAQSAPLQTGAANSIQPSPATVAVDEPNIQAQPRVLNLPAGTRLDIETSYTINSRDMRPGDLLTFRVLVPVKIDDADVIPMGALVTGRVVKAKRGGHWGKAGKLAWTMEDVVAVDLTRVPLTANPDIPAGEHKVTGTSHGGQVAAEMAIFGSLMMFAAPLVLMSGFKRGEDAVLPQGKRFVVYVAKETKIRVRDNER